MRIECPFCGSRHVGEFTYHYEAETEFPALDATIEDWSNAVYSRSNIAGRNAEIWHHTQGCQMWLKIDRDTLTHEVFSVVPASPGRFEVLEEQK